MKILCIPGLSEDEVEKYEKKLNTSSGEQVFIIPHTGTEFHS